MSALEHPVGDADLELVRNTHPADWVNPSPASRYHLVVIGGGTAGLVAAAGAAGLGARVALIESALLGGDCLNYGCVPSKGVLAAAHAWHSARAGRFGAPVAPAEGDFAAAMNAMREARAAISAHDSARRFADLGIDVFLGRGTFISPTEIAVGDARLRFRRAVVATGARAAVPSITGIDSVDYLTNETIFGLTSLPRRLLVLGAGPIGCEMAQAFARFGSEVVMIDRGARILQNDDPDAAEIVAKALERDGVRIVLGATADEVRHAADGIELVVSRDGASRATFTGDRLLVAVGRAPNVAGLGLEAGGISFDRTGVLVDDRMRTTNRRVYASGDVASTLKFTHLADAQSRIVIANSLFFGRGRASRLIVPWCTFTAPELAQVGLTREAAASAGVAFDEVVVRFDDVDRAVVEGETDGFLRLILAAGKDRILGATLVGTGAGDMISELTLAMQTGTGLGSLASVIHPYPTRAEIIRKAADSWRRRKLTSWARRVLRTWFRVFR